MSYGRIRMTMTCGASALLLALAALPAPAVAGALQVDPIKLEISQQRRTASVTVRNEERTPVTIRAYPLGWSQADGEDVYQDSSAVIVSPPVFTIPAGGTQVVRVGLRTPAAANRAYRLMIEEVPEATPGAGVQVALRLNLPLYAMVAEGSPSDIGWAVMQRPDGWALEATNRGTGYVRVDADQARAGAGVRAAAGTNFGVVLPGASRVWPIGQQPDIVDRARFISLNRTNQGAQPPLARRSD